MATVQAATVQMQAPLAIDDGAFMLVTLREAASAGRLQQAQADAPAASAPAEIISLSGTATDDGQTITLTVENVIRSGKRLPSSAELERYTGCAITGTLSDNLYAELLASAASCVLAANDATAVPVTANSVTVAPVAADVRPIDALIGAWHGWAYGETEVLWSRWEFSDDALHVVQFYPSSAPSGALVVRLDNLVVTDVAIVGMTIGLLEWCNVGVTDCQSPSPGNVAGVNDNVQQTLPWPYVVHNGVLTLSTANDSAVLERGEGTPPPPPPTEPLPPGEPTEPTGPENRP